MLNRRVGSMVLVVAVVATGSLLAAWKHSSLAEANAAASNQPEPVEAVQAAVAREREYRPVTTAIGTVVATRSISVRNELPGTVRSVTLEPGQIVERGTVLVALDVAVEQAELKALEAQAELAQTQFARVTKLSEQRAVSAEEVDSTRAARDVALAQIARSQSDDRSQDDSCAVSRTRRHLGRASRAVPERGHVPDELAGRGRVRLRRLRRRSADRCRPAQRRQGSGADGSDRARSSQRSWRPMHESIRRRAMHRSARRSPDAKLAPPPGASVRVQVPAGVARLAVAIPASALRKGPGGDFVFVVAQDKDSKSRAQQRPVQVEALAGDEVVIRDGLVVGEQVATSGLVQAARCSAGRRSLPKPESVAANSGAAAHVAL